MDQDVERKIVAILNILKAAKAPLGSRIISQKLKAQGIDLTERAVRYHLRIMDERGLTERQGQTGRIITQKGVEEANNALVSDKVGMIINKINALSYQTNFDLEKRTGVVILNVSLVPQNKFKQALAVMKEVFKARICVGDFVALVKPGENLGDLTVPEGMIGLGTICSVTINGILLHQYIPVNSKLAGILQIQNSQPLRLTEMIYYSGSSLDPAEIFIKGKMTNVRGAAKEGMGKILTSFSEIPALCLEATEDILNKLMEIGFSGVISLGKPSQPVLEIPVGIGQVGMVVAGGLNPLAAVEESGIETENYAMHTMIEFEKLVNFWEL